MSQHELPEPVETPPASPSEPQGENGVWVPLPPGVSGPLRIVDNRFLCIVFVSGVLTGMILFLVASFVQFMIEH
jgi:hypothetical protein